MLRKSLLIFISLISILSVQVFAQNCEFDTYNSSCPRFSTSFNTFNLNFAPIDKYDSFDARIYNKYNPYNEISIELNRTTKQIKNINPFIESGVYVIEIKSYNKGKISFIQNYEYIFDNLEPSAPIISLNLQSNSNEINIIGKTEEKTIRVIAEVSGKTPIEVQSNNFEFSLNLTNLNSGLNYVKFYTISQNGLKSYEVERIIVSNGIIENNVEIAAGLTISNLSINGRTYLQSNEYYTTKQNFYITGTAVGNKGAEIYVNGQRAIFDGNNYGAFILLNKGKNEVTIQSGIENKNITINYINVDFRFLKFDYDKVFLGDFIIKGNTSVNLPFDIYVNGNYFDTNSNYLDEGNGKFSFEYLISENNLTSGKNYIYLFGYNHQYLSEIIYKDMQNPVIEIMSFDKIANYKELVFKITDDIAVDDNSLILHLGPYTFTSSSSKLSGDMYIFDISEVPQNTYNYDIYVKDLTGKEISKQGNIIINNENTLIEKFTDSNNQVYSLGNRVFMQSGKKQLRITPSKFIAFEKIYLDGIDQINYEILSDGTILLNIDTNKTTGSLKFTFINNKYEKFEQEYIYYTDNEKPQIKLDYITSAYSKTTDSILVTGKIEDSHFNWSSLRLNGQNITYHFGNYFEARVIPSSDFTTLTISGNDYSMNSLTKIYSNILVKDSTITGVSINQVSNIFSASVLNTQSLNSQIYSHSRMKNYIYDFGGLNIKNLVISSQFELSLPQRNGLETLNLKGVESSGNLFEKRTTVNLDSFNPIIYLYYNESSNKYMIVVDGTYSNISIVNITSNNYNLDQSSCNYKPQFITFGYCRYLYNLSNIEKIDVYAEDMSKNSKFKSFNLSDAIIVSKIRDIIPPQIVLNPDNLGNISPIQILKDSNYNELGASCIDNVDRTCTVIITGTVNTNILGNYSIRYTAQDTTGNNRTLIRIIRVVEEYIILPSTDISAPIITIPSLGLTEILINSTFINPNASCIDNVDNNCQVIITGSVNTTILGNYTLTYCAIDSSLNNLCITSIITVVNNLSQKLECENKFENIHLSYNSNFTRNNNFSLQGNYIINCDSVLGINITNGFGEKRGDCELGQNSFICNALLDEGDNMLNIIITGIDGHKINKSIIIKKDSINPLISIKSIRGSQIYNAGNNIYYINDPNIILSINLSEESLVKVLIGGEVSLNSIKNNVFDLNINLTNRLVGKENENLNLQVIAIDKNENEGFTEIITLIYNRVAKLFTQVNVN